MFALLHHRGIIAGTHPPCVGDSGCGRFLMDRARQRRSGENIQAKVDFGCLEAGFVMTVPHNKILTNPRITPSALGRDFESGAPQFDELAKLIPIPRPWAVREYLRRVAEARQRPITVLPVETGRLAGSGCGTGSGLWIGREHDDIILHTADTTAWHAEHIICHEVGHMLLAHDRDTDEELDEAALLKLMPSLSPQAIRSVLRREDYASPRERAAETFADLVMVHASLPHRGGSRFHSTFFPGRQR